jgi:hypothetical protein
MTPEDARRSLGQRVKWTDSRRLPLEGGAGEGFVRNVTSRQVTIEARNVHALTPERPLGVEKTITIPLESVTLTPA